MKCIICKKEDYSHLYPEIVRCNKCGLVFYNQTVGQDKIAKIYQENYFCGDEYLNYRNDRKIIQNNFQKRLKTVIKYVKRGSLLEIGCAYGFFLDLAKKYFNILGIDICEKPIAFAQKKHGNEKIICDNFLSFNLSEKKDVICLWDTIEHLERPDLFIKKSSQDLKKGGYIFLTTGDIESFVARTRKEKWRMIHPPTHLFYFSKKTITKLLQKNSFKVIKISYPGVYRNLGQILFSIFKTGKGIFGKLDFPVYLNTYDIMMVIARRE